MKFVRLDIKLYLVSNKSTIIFFISNVLRNDIPQKFLDEYSYRHVPYLNIY